MVEPKVTIVDCIVANLGADVTYLDTRHRLVILKVSDGHNKGLNTIVTLDGDTPCKDDSMGRLNSEIAWPEFARL